MYLDRRAANGKVKGLKSYYYILNNLIRHTINPKDGAASDQNGYVRNVLARFALGGDKFNVPRFMWQEIRVAMDDARKGLPYAPYLMFVIERVTGYQFVKNGLHEQYKIEKARHAKTSETIASPSDVPESSRSGTKKRKNKMVQWIKALFGKCTYAAERAYETQLEQREMRASANLPPLPPCHLLHTMTCLVFQILRTRMRMTPRSLTTRRP